MTKNEKIAAELKWLRVHSGWTQADAAAQMGVTRVAYNGWETGRTPMPEVKLFRFRQHAAKAFAEYKEPLEYTSDGYPIAFDLRLRDKYEALVYAVDNHMYLCERTKRELPLDDAEDKAFFKALEEAEDAYYDALVKLEGDDFVPRALVRARSDAFRRFVVLGEDVARDRADKVMANYEAITEKYKSILARSKVKT